MSQRPEPNEYAEYYGRYIEKVPDGDIVEILSRQVEETVELLAIPPERETYRYAAGKWSVREVVGHMTDVERVFALRALAFARKDPAALPSFEQDDYAATAGAHERALPELADEYRKVRASNVAMFQSFTKEAWARAGVASGCTFTVRAVAWIVAGHELHHREVLETRYL